MLHPETNTERLQVVVPGAMHTVISVINVPGFPGVGEDAFGSGLQIGSGGKSRNIAEMTGWLADGSDRVAMISETARDPYGLWRLPYDALHEAGVNTDYIGIRDTAETGVYPGIALVTVDAKGDRNASVCQTVMDEFSAANIDRATPLFEAAARNSGILALSMELPYDTAAYAMRRAADYGLRTILDPGGLAVRTEYDALFQNGLFLIKPNEHEATQLTGVEITGFETAKEAAAILMERGAERVLITHADQGAYLFTETETEHIGVPEVPLGGQTDATGCGDQVMGGLCAWLGRGADVATAARLGVVAGTLQYHRVGTPPVKLEELAQWVS